MNVKAVKTLGLLSGGLDSTIAVKLMVKLGFDVTVLNFMSPFCTCTTKNDGCKSAARKVASEMGIKIRTLFMGKEYLEMLRAPRFGVGKGLNPCIDCRIMMFGRAKQVMEEIGARFIFTGEVVGQRPMSQMRNRLKQIEKESNLKGLIVRLLSAALLEPTIPETEGLIDRNKMLAISGRSRQKQIEAGRELGMAEENLCSSGGCLLTDRIFAAKMKDLINHAPETSVREARMLRVGRHFRLSDNCKAIVGRNEKENEKLSGMAPPGSSLLRVLGYPGPCVLLTGAGDNGGSCVTAGKIAARYSDAPKECEVEVEITTAGLPEDAGEPDKIIISVLPIDDDKLNEIRV